MADSSIKAELWGLRTGLTLAKNEKITKLEIEVDALAVLLLTHDYNTVNHPLDNLLLDCRSLMQEFEQPSIKHIYREANRCADALTNDRPISVGDLYIYPSASSCITKVFSDLVEVSYPTIVNA